MDLESRLSELSKRVSDHREVLQTEEAAKNALVLPVLQALGYDVFNPSELVPEFTCDVGTKRGEKVDYAVRIDGRISILVECKPAGVELDLNHASQLFRYFSTTEARVAILTNGVVYKFFSDTVASNKMDESPFFTFHLDRPRKADFKTLANFTKSNFNLDIIKQEAGHLRMQSLVHGELEKEFAEPSDELVKLIASRVHTGRLNPTVKDIFRTLITNSVAGLIRDRVNERLTSALTASNPPEDQNEDSEVDKDGIVTTDDEVAGYHIVRAIAAKAVDPKRVHMRDAKSYCAILLDDNNRRTVARMHFNSAKSRYLGVFSGKEEQRFPVTDLTDIYKHADQITARVIELTQE